MVEHPILMSAPMVRAILEGRKTQTRRVVQLPRWAAQDELTFANFDVVDYGKFGEALETWDWGPCPRSINCPYGKPGDRLWVREAWRGAWHVGESTNFHLMYPADGSEAMKYVDEEYVLPKAAAKPENIMTPLFMPRWASRLTLEITAVRVQRLQEISEQDVVAEGCTNNPADGVLSDYHTLWESINGKKHPWDSNPWIWAVTFVKLDPPPYDERR